jgi:hypothetical protein
MKLTPWFNTRDHTPVRTGVYQVYVLKDWHGRLSTPYGGFYSMWDGKVWRCMSMSKEEAARSELPTRCTLGFWWRGVKR